jgi:IS30 family transposase
MSKFFTYEERLELQKYLKENLSFKEISRRLHKNPTTISREVRKHSSEIATGYPGFPFNACKNRFNCRLKKVCGKECSRKSVPLDPGVLTFAMGVKRLENVHF